MRGLTLRRFGIVEEKHEPDKLMLDFDSPKFATPLTVIYTFLRNLRLGCRWIRFDRTLRGWHAIIKMRKRLRPAEIIAAQAALGSDKKREEMNLARVIAMRENPPPPFWRDRFNILFSEKIT